MEDRTIAQVVQPARRCRGCGAKAAGRSCQECGAKVGPRQEIGVLAGVGQNFGTVNNVYNFGGEGPEIVDFRDIQDGLNERFPERIPPAGPPQDVRLLPPPGVPSKLVQTANTMTYVWFALVVAAMIGTTILFATCKL